ncbi:hypothetical protein [Streptomyces sp. 6N223]|uniref:hypothetical protein n=1 Tax=Streptomyces sp. 6N223 TaxID=3457412 RepID=UPI003FD559ED
MKSITLTRKLRFRTGLVAGFALLALTGTVTGCSSSEDEGGEPIEGAQTNSPDPSQSPEDDDNSADVAALERLYQEYWDARIELENTEELDFSHYDGITTSAVVEQEGTQLQQFRNDGIYRQGEPTITDVTVEVTGDTARIEACKSEEGWDVVQNGDVIPDAVPETLLAPHPYLVAAERSADSWLISRTSLPKEEATITCG